MRKKEGKSIKLVTVSLTWCESMRGLKREKARRNKKKSEEKRTEKSFFSKGFFRRKKSFRRGKRKKMKKAIAFLAIAAIVLSAVAVGTAMAAKHGEAGKSNVAHLYLYEKDPDDWSIVEDGAWGKMKYNLAGPEFDFVFNGHGLNSSIGDYILIYYPGDYEGNPRPRVGIRCLTRGTADGDGDIHLADSTELNSDLPMAGDTNSGAKILLVESRAVRCITNNMSEWWNPTEYLFEHSLITYDDTDV